MHDITRIIAGLHPGNNGDINNYQKFMRICAGRIGQVLNANSLSNELGVSSERNQICLNLPSWFYEEHALL